MVDERDSNPGLPHCEQWENKLRQAPQSLSYFTRPLIGKPGKPVFSCLFGAVDGEKPDEITRGACACACNDDKVIFENPLN